MIWPFNKNKNLEQDYKRERRDRLLADRRISVLNSRITEMSVEIQTLRIKCKILEKKLGEANETNK